LGYRGGCQRGRHNALDGQRGRYGNKPGTALVAWEESSEEVESGSTDDDSDDDSEDEY
jgi:hypothetical protein